MKKIILFIVFAAQTQQAFCQEDSIQREQFASGFSAPGKNFLFDHSGELWKRAVKGLPIRITVSSSKKYFKG